MAQTGYTPISIYYSSTTTNVPTAGNLVAGELAINTADGKLFYKDSAGVVQVIGTKGGVGSSTTTQVLYNSSGSLAGSANMTFNGTTFTLANDASISGLTVGKGGGAVSTNTAVGYQAVNATATGGNNVALGYQALLSNTSGTSNTALGRQAGYALSAGLQNTAVGANAMDSGDASYSVAVGHTALSASSGSYNTAVGNQALKANTTASNNTAVGYQAGYSNTTGTGNAYFGKTAGYGKTGNYNTGIGTEALYASGSGSQNTGVGFDSFQGTTSGSDNTGLGFQSGYQNTTGSSNIAVGSGALFNNTTANNNTVVGYQALYSNTTSSYSVAIGYQAGYAQTSGVSYNNFFGAFAGNSVTSGTSNTFIGAGSSGSAGDGVTTGSYNVILGAYRGSGAPISATGSNYIVLSDGAGNARGYYHSGDVAWYFPAVYTTTSASAANCGIASNGYLYRSTSALKYKQDIRDLESIDVNKFRPVRYKSKSENDDQTKDYFGIIADEVDAAGITELVSYGAEGEVEGFQYERLTVVLLKAIQELKAEFDAYKATHP